VKRPPRGRAGWARYFAKLLEEGHPEAAAVLRDLAAAEPDKPASKPKDKAKLPRGVFEKVPGSGDYWIRFADSSGKIRRQRIGHSLSAARDLVEQRRTEVRHGRFNPESLGKPRRQMTVKAMFETYLPLRVSVKNKGEDARYAAYWTDVFGKLALDDLTREDLLRWRSQRASEVKPATVNRALTYLRAYFNLALADGHCKANPAQDGRGKKGGRLLLKESASRERVLAEDEQARLQEALAARHFVLVEFALQTGLRLSEQFSLRWEHVDEDQGLLLVADSKSGQPRFVPINKRTRELLQVLKESGQGSSWVFASRANPNRPVNHKNFIRRVFKPAVERAGLDALNWHDLRRTAGSRLAMAGVPLNTVGDILGHLSGRVTKIYARLSKGHLKEAMEALS